MEILTLKNLSFRYPEAGEEAVRDVSFSIRRGEFVVLCGATGSGKSTLLRLLKRELIPLGERRGEVFFDGTPQDDLSPRAAAEQIAYVMQHPEQQLVTDKVWHELAFGLENLGYPRDVICRRVAEMASYFGIESWFDRQVDTLSGGQKQLLNLASVMTMQPRILLLDEPTAQLDPIAASNFVRTLQKLNRELSLTVVIAEHRLEELMLLCDRVLVMDGGRLIADSAPRGLAAQLPCNAPLLRAMPSAVRVYRALENDNQTKCPLTEREGRAYIETTYRNTVRSLPEDINVEANGEEAMRLQEAFFRYERGTPDVLRGMSLSVRAGESLCILGGNGAGKTTLLGVLAGIHRCYSGQVTVFGKNIRSYRREELYRGCVAMLPQDVQTVFLRDTVREELRGCERAEAMLPYSLKALYDRHPYDISGGEQQLVALARVLSTEPRLLLLDEPTKGLDAFAKEGILKVIRALKEQGMTIITVTHDVEFAARCADRCAMFFRGEITSVATPRVFFAENSFYTTAAARMSRDHFDGAVTVEDVIALCRENGIKDGAL
ncbi:MAG: energy-coupling factor ABC transporter ATP-binding protein [Clostridia bacterium]|nr:energy-coupling factor ABC transporter ATP-binding protein [Clostridia bacterium]